MARKSSKDTSRALEDFPQWIQQLGRERLFSGKQIFDYRTHKPLPRYGDMADSDRRAVLVCTQLWAKKFGKEPVFRSQEKRLLARIFKSDGTRLPSTQKSVK